MVKVTPNKELKTLGTVLLRKNVEINSDVLKNDNGLFKFTIPTGAGPMRDGQGAKAWTQEMKVKLLFNLLVNLRASYLTLENVQGHQQARKLVERATKFGDGYCNDPAFANHESDTISIDLNLRKYLTGLDYTVKATGLDLLQPLHMGTCFVRFYKATILPDLGRFKDRMKPYLKLVLDGDQRTPDPYNWYISRDVQDELIDILEPEVMDEMAEQPYSLVRPNIFFCF